ncbi:MAG: hypothetical protein IIB40_10905 [Candidatus Marinimicrobia bacterium]|nr:hypothetical protein [Candidatus Neomarinimicrobiota bacterium]
MSKKIIITIAIGALMAGSVLVSDSWAQELKDFQSRRQDIYSSGQRAYTQYKKPIEAKVLDRRFVPREAMFMANQSMLSGTFFFEDAVEAGLPVINDKDFFHMTSVEAYWYSRYNLSNLLGKSRMGIHLVHGPYLTYKALKQKDNVFYNRDRAERELANREVLLGQIIPMYLARTGFPRRFEDASPIMLEFASGDPTLPRKVDINDDFEGGNGQPDFEDTYLTLRWNANKIDKSIDMGGVGQTLLKQALWMEYFFTQNHDDGRLLGNDAEEGFRGAMLNLMSVSKMLMLKSALFYDGKKLTGINPVDYNPDEKLYYLPHLLDVRLIQPGDIPPRPEWFTVKDKSSQLFDQASMLWGTTEYFYFSDPNVEDNWDNVFGENTPYDGSIMEQQFATALSSGLSDVLLKNIEKMHWDKSSGSLVSEWNPKTGQGSTISLLDAGIAMHALANYHRHLEYDSELQEKASRMLKAQADFLVNKLQNNDGSFPDGYDFDTQKAIGQEKTLIAQGMAIQGLMQAYKELDENKYLQAALKAYTFMNDKLWHDDVGVYRSSVGATESVYTPITFGATYGAMRAIILQTKSMNEVERFKQFFVQAVNRSGVMQAEEIDTGEKDLTKFDGDNDGIPQFQYAKDGKKGIAAVFASKVMIKTPLETASATAGLFDENE